MTKGDVLSLLIETEPDTWKEARVVVDCFEDGEWQFEDGASVPVKIYGGIVEDTEAAVLRYDEENQTVDLFSFAFGGLNTVPAKIYEMPGDGLTSEKRKEKITVLEEKLKKMIKEGSDD